MSELTEKMMELEREQNKEVEPYPRVLSKTANSPKTKKAGKDKYGSPKGTYIYERW